ncbi:11813_t:CDS:2 [Dentiscutata heterogama]|uniref:11813_t:CDS:1 n=1 Tax=Dentiscutata heterogama TaxID=1316150 RepID=A0ACA9L995_9GLOM|nr:11813_t:CDS:2 [Dentiscutata heterogama]
MRKYFNNENDGPQQESNNTSEDEPTFVDTLEIFDETNFDITWNLEDQFGIFENFTMMAMFIWAVKYIISKTAYHDLIQILLHPQFNKNYLITNLQTLKKYQEKLPLIQIQSYKVPINP